MTGVAKSPRVTPLALAFQTDLDRLIAEPVPRVLRLWPALGLGLIAALVIVSAFARVDIVVTAQGRLSADAPPMMLRPMARAVLLELLVRPGDLVQPGQILARLDATLPEADKAALAAEKSSLEAEIARIEADLAGRVYAAPGADAALQADLQRRNANSAAARRQALSSAISALREQTAIELAMGAGLEERLAIARAIEDKRRELFALRAAPEVDVLAARAARLTAEAEVSAHRARLSDLDRRTGAAENDLAVFASDLNREAANALPRLRLRLVQIDDALQKAARLASLSALVAPRAGVVISVAPGGIGAVMTEGEPVVVLIPSDTTLLADIGVPSSDLGRVAVGDLVTVKIDAFPWRRFGLAEGRIDSLGPVSLTPEGGGDALHPARVALLSGPSNLSADTQLLPGMTLSAEVRTGTRSVLDFFLDPLQRGLSESLREP